MHEPEMIIYSCAPSALKNKWLSRALLLSFVPSLLFITPLKPLGLQDQTYWLFPLAILIIATAFIPYQRLKRSENSPIELRCCETSLLLKHRKRSRHIPKEKILSIVQQGGALSIRTRHETVDIAHFAPNTAQRMQEYFKLSIIGS